MCIYLVIMLKVFVYLSCAVVVAVERYMNKIVLFPVALAFSASVYGL